MGWAARANKPGQAIKADLKGRKPAQPSPRKTWTRLQVAMAIMGVFGIKSIRDPKAR